MTLSKALIGSNSLVTKGMMVLTGSLFIALAAQISVPMFPVPMTLQTLAILIVGLTFGARLGAATLVAYLAEGAMGLPVFANGGLGLATFVGPTGGFLIGFVGMAYLAGLAADRGYAKGFFSTALVAVAVSALLYVPGLAWPLGVASVAGVEAGWAGLPAAKVIAGFAQPFLIGDVVKAVIAALVVSGAWKALELRKG
ncbi:MULTISPECIES: biotin transporter BioY [Halocynthiibacter]|uniref:Biotin transporter n=1 Tax=Halocynthiibacter halioticoli TaxID=2986804 RepID=A0AAE3IZQ4_9RHOB|nr:MULTISPECIES: biotin transporter BioY [Halocynthiibacter]MCV6824674.1 biotin transporter BioY [Halocynthiibacter halioticoli]MCW4057675.1 biotin transporter BioY [Halocynthiibacter sp. SDUM655004]